MPRGVRHWTLTMLREWLIKIGWQAAHHSRRIIFQLADAVVSGDLFQTILNSIDRLHLPSLAGG